MTVTVNYMYEAIIICYPDIHPTSCMVVFMSRYMRHHRVSLDNTMDDSLLNSLLQVKRVRDGEQDDSQNSEAILKLEEELTEAIEEKKTLAGLLAKLTNKVEKLTANIDTSNGKLLSILNSDTLLPVVKEHASVRAKMLGANHVTKGVRALGDMVAESLAFRHLHGLLDPDMIADLGPCKQLVPVPEPLDEKRIEFVRAMAQDSKSHQYVSTELLELGKFLKEKEVPLAAVQSAYLNHSPELAEAAPVSESPPPPVTSPAQPAWTEGDIALREYCISQNITAQNLIASHVVTLLSLEKKLPERAQTEHPSSAESAQPASGVETRSTADTAQDNSPAPSPAQGKARPPTTEPAFRGFGDSQRLASANALPDRSAGMELSVSHSALQSQTAATPGTLDQRRSVLMAENLNLKAQNADYLRGWEASYILLQQEVSE